MKKFREQFYPYFFATIAAVLCFLLRFFSSPSNNLINVSNLSDALTAAITAISILIGFLGTMIPVILSARTTPSAVNEILAQDTQNLFPKYLEQTLILGIISLISTILSFFLNVKDELAFNILLSLLLWVLTSFLLCAFRSFHLIIKLLFQNSSDGEKPSDFSTISHEEQEFFGQMSEDKSNKETN